MTEPVWRTHLGATPSKFIAAYYGNPRPEVVDRLGITPTCLLEIGCGSGATGRLVKERFPDCKVIGVEANASAAALARSHLDVVFACTFEDLDPTSADFPAGKVDAVILCDVLEHMVNPWATLEKLRQVVAPGARILASIPNVRNLIHLDQVLRGQWQYQDQGILDVTHLRFFCLKDMQRMFTETGFRVLTSFRLADDRLGWIKVPPEGETINLDAGMLQLRKLSRQDVLELTAVQFILQSEPA
jgi:SAM-dependent methyltransferase